MNFLKGIFAHSIALLVWHVNDFDLPLTSLNIFTSRDFISSKSSRDPSLNSDKPHILLEIYVPLKEVDKKLKNPLLKNVDSSFLPNVGNFYRMQKPVL
jgi:hypothetical protein